MSKAKTDKALFAALRAARGNLSQCQVATRRRLVGEANVQSFVAVDLSQSKNIEEEKEIEKRKKEKTMLRRELGLLPLLPSHLPLLNQLSLKTMVHPSCLIGSYALST